MVKIKILGFFLILQKRTEKKNLLFYDLFDENEFRKSYRQHLRFQRSQIQSLQNRIRIFKRKYNTELCIGFVEKRNLKLNSII